jgi:phosphatidylethanolamine/phosphatidyl-N-methylethanolamine N-methyltransferase
MLRRPGRIGAVSPSSGALARAMTRDLSPDSGSVVELGGGTGKITEAILARGVRPENLTVLETNPIFANLLRERFPAIQVLELDARKVGDAPMEDVHRIISGLPMLAIPTSAQRQIVEGAFRLMQPGGVFVQFTYGWRPPLERTTLKSLGLVWAVSPWVLRNVPPAQVYRFRLSNPATAD